MYTVDTSFYSPVWSISAVMFALLFSQVPEGKFQMLDLRPWINARVTFSLMKFLKAHFIHFISSSALEGSVPTYISLFLQYELLDTQAVDQGKCIHIIVMFHCIHSHSMDNIHAHVFIVHVFCSLCVLTTERCFHEGHTEKHVENTNKAVQNQTTISALW